MMSKPSKSLLLYVSSGTFLFGEEHGNVELLIFESNTSLPLRKLKSKVTLHQTIILRGLLKAEIFIQETSKGITHRSRDVLDDK